jgi:hypothetical protein
MSTGGGGSNIGAATKETNTTVGAHRLIAKASVDRVLARAGMPNDKLFASNEPPYDAKRATERAALAKVLALRASPEADKHDAAKNGDWDPKTKTATLGHDAERVLKDITPEQHEGLRKYSNGYDFTMKQLETGASPTKLAQGVEAFWNSQLAKKGMDPDTMSADSKARAYQENFKHASGTEHVQAAQQALDHVNDMFARTPPTPGVVYRGMKNVTPEVVEKILNSKTMTLDSMSSFSFNHGVGHDYATGEQASKAAGDKGARAAVFGEDKVMPNGVAIVMRVSHKSGVNMMGASDFKKEQEVLLPKGAKFRLSNVTREGNFDAHNLKNNDPPIIVVHMEEI